MDRTRSGRERYDVVIIGSGIGGLTAGAYLAKNGVKVLICEQGRQPGGYFTSFKRKGYTFDGGIQGCEDTGILLPMLRELDLLDRIELRYSKLAYAFPDFFCPQKQVADLARFYGHLKKVFPHESKAIEYPDSEPVSGGPLDHVPGRGARRVDDGKDRKHGRTAPATLGHLGRVCKTSNNSQENRMIGWRHFSDTRSGA